ncbi:MAG: hypothetical protein ABIH34_04150 [Nanoarchaeota archaeon]
MNKKLLGAIIFTLIIIIGSTATYFINSLFSHPVLSVEDILENEPEPPQASAEIPMMISTQQKTIHA